MSQLTPYVPGPKPMAVTQGTSPDVVFVLRHYRWLLIIGTLVGTLLALSAFWVARSYFPLYASWVKYQVLPPKPNTPIDNSAPQQAESPEDTLRFIARQRDIVTSNDALLQAVLQRDQFQYDYRDMNKPAGQRRQSQFLLAHPNKPELALKDLIDVVPIPNTDLYSLTLYGSDPQAVHDQVAVFAQEYENYLRKQTDITTRNRLQDLESTQQDLQQRVAIRRQEAENFREAHDIPGLTQTSSRLTQELGALDSSLVQAQTATNQSRDYLQTIQKQIDTNSFKMPADGQQVIDNDPQVIQLQDEKRALERERDVMLDNHGAAYPAVKDLDIRIAACQKQADGLRDEATARVRLSIIERAKSAFAANQAVEQDLQSRRDNLLLQVKDLDKWLADYATRMDQLNQQQAILDKLNQNILILQVSQNSDASRIHEIGASDIPDQPVFPILWKFMCTGIFGGLLASFGLAYLLELTNTRVRTPRDITRTMQMPLLGFVPDQEDDGMVNGDLMTSIRTSPTSMIAESFRQIRGRLAAEANGRPLGTMLVASVAPGGGATTVASNLANGIALNDVRVLLIDANFYRPGLSSIYRNIPAVGLGDVIAGKVQAEAAIVASLELPTLHLMGIGSKPTTTSSELLESKAFREALNSLKNKYDLIIFDGAPLSLVSDSLSLASKLDGVIAVVRAGTVSRGTVGRIRDQLRQVHANLLGLVLNAAQTHGSGYFKENYRSFYQYASVSNVPHKPAPSLTN